MSFLTRLICMAEYASFSSFPAFLSASFPTLKQDPCKQAQLHTYMNLCRAK